MRWWARGIVAAALACVVATPAGADPALEAELQAKWKALREALSRDDVPGALALIASRSRESYREPFLALQRVGELRSAANDLCTLHRIEHEREAVVEYDCRGMRNGFEQSFPVRFIRDADGVWRIWRF